MPRVKSTPFHLEVYILKKVKKLPCELIHLIYTFCNKNIKYIYNPKFEWYISNIHIHTIEFNIKFKILLNNFSLSKLRNFYDMIVKNNSEVYNYLLDHGNLDKWNINYSRSTFYGILMHYLTRNMDRYILYKKAILSNKIIEERFYKVNINTIEKCIFLYKSILYLYSKLFQETTSTPNISMPQNMPSVQLSS